MSLEIEKRWRRILDLDKVQRLCHCGKSFVCTGNCPSHRWNSGTHEDHPIDCCFCPDCLLRSNFGQVYLSKRQKYCFRRGEDGRA